MKKIKLSSRSKLSGQGMVIAIILLAVVGAGLWYLYSNKATTDREAREFAREAIKRITVDHDLKYFSDHLGPQAKLDNPPSQQQFIIQRFAAGRSTTSHFRSNRCDRPRRPLIVRRGESVCGGSILAVGCARPKAARANRGKSATTFPASRGASSIHFG